MDARKSAMMAPLAMAVELFVEGVMVRDTWTIIAITIILSRPTIHMNART